MTDEPQPKGFHESDNIEKDTERIIKDCFKYEISRVNFETIDKYPNRDGFIEILDANLIPVGDLIIQVKKIPDKNIGQPKKQINSRTLAYGYITNAPFILLGVDTTNEVVYWRHASGEWLDSLELGKADSRMVEFPKTNIITGEDSSELLRLKRISVDESEYLKSIEQSELLADTLTYIYNTYGQKPFQGAALRKDIPKSWIDEHGITITPGILDKLSTETNLIKKLSRGQNAVAIVDKNAATDELAVASINDTSAVQKIAFRVLRRNDAGQMTAYPIDWNSPNDVIGAVNPLVGRSVLDVAKNTRYYRLTGHTLDLIEST